MDRVWTAEDRSRKHGNHGAVGANGLVLRSPYCQLEPFSTARGPFRSVLVRSRRCSRTPPRPHGSINASEKEDKEKKMTDREHYTPTAAKLWNWRLWAGFGLSIGALAGYGYFVMETRAVFWPALLLFVVAAVLLVSGLKRRSREPELYRGKIAGPVLTTLSVLILGLFGFVVYEVLRAFPDAKNAPQIGQRAPEFSLVDANGKNITLAQLLSTPITNSGSAARASKGVLVVFYRGYW